MKEYRKIIPALLIIFLGTGALAVVPPRIKTVPADSAASIQAKDFSVLLGMEGFSDTLLNNHFKLYQGYVKNTNSILEKLGILAANNKDNTPEYAELKRRLGWELNGALLHEYYFENLGGTGGPEEGSALYENITESFGSFELWKKDFTSTAAMRGIGWAILCLEPRTGKLINVWVTEHDTGQIAAAKPLAVLDVFEHAYMTDYQIDRGKYIASFFKKLNWAIVKKRFDKANEETGTLISANEDLMREHGVISRLLLIYEEIIKRINNNEVFPAEPLSQSTDIVSSFIQGYHEVLEEKYIFDRFRKTNNLAYMIAALEEQHKAGRKITYAIKAQQNAPDKNRLASSLRAFINMYRPHKAQEDTVLFPAFRNIVPPDEYAGLAEQFEKEEEIVFGKGGFKKVASQVEEIEKSLGINELSKFTP